MAICPQEAITVTGRCLSVTDLTDLPARGDAADYQSALIQNGRAARRFREQQGIRYANREGLIVIMGYSKVVYQRGIKRTLAAIDWYP